MTKDTRAHADPSAIQAILSQLEAVKSERDAVEKKAAALAGDFDRERDSKNTLLLQKAALDKEVGRLRGVVGAQSQDLSKQRLEIEALRAQVRELTKERAAGPVPGPQQAQTPKHSEGAEEKKCRQCSESKETIEHFLSEAATVKGVVKQLRANLASEKAKCDSLRKENKQLQDEAKGGRELLLERSKVLSLQQQLHQCSAELQTTQSQSSTALSLERVKIESLTSRVQKLEQVNNDLEAQVAQLQVNATRPQHYTRGSQTPVLREVAIIEKLEQELARGRDLNASLQHESKTLLHENECLVKGSEESTNTFTEQLTEVKKQLDNYRKLLKEANTKSEASETKVTQLLASYKALEAKHTQQEAELEALAAQHKASVGELNKERETALCDLAARHTAALSELHAAHDAALNDLRTQHEAEAQRSEKLEETLRDFRCQHEAETLESKQLGEETARGLRCQYEAEVQRSKNLEEVLRGLRCQYEAETQKMQWLEEMMSDLRCQYEAEAQKSQRLEEMLSDLRCQHEAEAERSQRLEGEVMLLQAPPMADVAVQVQDASVDQEVLDLRQINEMLKSELRCAELRVGELTKENGAQHDTTMQLKFELETLKAHSLTHEVELDKARRDIAAAEKEIEEQRSQKDHVLCQMLTERDEAVMMMDSYRECMEGMAQGNLEREKASERARERDSDHSRLSEPLSFVQTIRLGDHFVTDRAAKNKGGWAVYFVTVCRMYGETVYTLQLDTPFTVEELFRLMDTERLYYDKQLTTQELDQWRCSWRACETKASVSASQLAEHISYLRKKS